MSLPAPRPGQTVLITGASSGIGEQLARRLALLGHGLTLVARREDRLRTLAGELRAEHGVKVDVRATDLGDDAARTALIEALRADPAVVAGVCNNAGFGSFGRFDGLPLEREQQMIRLNVLALHELTGAFLWPMVQRGEGAILNVASVTAFQPFPGFATYAATKAFVQSFSESLHAELVGTGVSVTTLSPGPVPTEFGDRAGIGDVEQMAGAAALSPQAVAAAAVRGMVRGRRTVTPGALNKGMALGGRLTPRTVLLPAAKRAAGQRLANPQT